MTFQFLFQSTYFCLHLGDGCVHVFLTVLENFNNGLLCTCWLGKRRDEALKDRRRLEDGHNVNENRIRKRNETDRNGTAVNGCSKLTGTAASNSLNSFFSGAFTVCFSAACSVSSLISGEKKTQVRGQHFRQISFCCEGCQKQKKFSFNIYSIRISENRSVIL